MMVFEGQPALMAPPFSPLPPPPGYMLGAGNLTTSTVAVHHKRPRVQQTFNPGDRVDAMDLESVWHEGRVREVDPIQGYRVHFLGWSGRWDEWIELTSERIQPAYTKLPNWRRALRVGDPIEVRSSIHTDRWLSGVVVAVSHEEDRVMCEYSHDSRWIDLTSEEICLPNTHFSRELDSLSPQKMEQIHRECEIHREVRAANAEAVKRIVAQDPAMIHLKGPLERTPILIAADSCHLEIIRILLDAGASLADIDRSNANCLHLAVRGQRDRCAAVVEELARRGADVNGRDSRLSTPLHLVAMRGYHDVGYSLIAHGADVNAKDMSQVTPLRHAAYRGEDAIVRLLLRYGADPTLTDSAGGRPIEVACFLRNKTRRHTVESLLTDGHRGHMCKKLRQIMVWTADEDQRERECTILLRRRREQQQQEGGAGGISRPAALPYVEFHPQGEGGCSSNVVVMDQDEGGDEDEQQQHDHGQAAPEGGNNKTVAVLQYVVKDLNRDMWVELMDFLA